jgi:hypothetical protein
MNAEQEGWWNRFKVQVASTRTFVSDARAHDQLEALDAFQDVLDEIRTDFLEETQKYRMTNRADYTGKAPRRIPSMVRPGAELVTSWLLRLAMKLEWHAAGLRARLKHG